MKTPLLYALALCTACTCAGCEDSVTVTEQDVAGLMEKLNTNDAVGDSEHKIRPSNPSDIPVDRNDLYSMRTVVKVYDGKHNSGIAVPGFGGLKLGKDEVNVNAYYIETKIVPGTRDTAVYGIGYSVHYLFKKVKRGLNLDNLPYVAASVEIDSKKTEVYYSLQTYGISGQPLVRYFKPVINKSFDVEGYGIMQSSIDGIHNVLGDSLLSKAVRFRPELLKNIKHRDLEE